MLYIYPYKMGSKGARTLRAALRRNLGRRVLLVKPDGRFRPKLRDVVINWGSSTIPIWRWSSNNLNSPQAVGLSSNKIATFAHLQNADVSTLEWTVDRNEAQEWLREGFDVVVRHTITGHSGEGVEILSEGEIPPAPLYTKYKKKRAEYRVHVFRGEVIDVCQKKRSSEALDNDSVDSRIRTHSHGWVFCRNDVVATDTLKELAVKAIRAIGLHFGAVDIIYNAHEDRYYVLEINSAPGLEGTTLQKYMEAILK